MKITFLGTGTSTGVPTLGCSCRVCTSEDPRDSRTRPSLLVEHEGRTIVIDTTPDFRTQALRQQVRRLDAILFTHSHADHVLGLDDVRPFYFRQQVPIPIYADAQCMEDIRRIFRYIFDGVYPYGGLARLDPHIVEGPFEAAGLAFTPVPVLHGNLPILGFRWEKAAYITDVSEIPEASFQLLEGVEVLILDALRPKPHPTHSTLERSLAWVERLKPRRAFFTHLAHEVSHEETQATLPPHVRLAYDGLEFEV
ncbi:MAG TPA: MBL fold metallo-hydrolase [Terriglobia bacterium]|nr:MBL fold metallo-hydrolase [Terriglobia bacterium]